MALLTDWWCRSGQSKPQPSERMAACQIMGRIMPSTRTAGLPGNCQQLLTRCGSLAINLRQHLTNQHETTTGMGIKTYSVPETVGDANPSSRQNGASYT